MPEQNKPDIPVSDAPSVDPQPDLYSYFSADTVELIGIEKANELLHLRAKIETGAKEAGEREAAYPEETRLRLIDSLEDPDRIQTSYIVSAAYDDYLRAHSPEAARELYYLYQELPADHKPIDGDLIDEAIQAEQEYIQFLQEIKQEVDPIFAAYDSASDQAVKDRIVHDMSAKLAVMWKGPLSQDQKAVLGAYLRSETVFSRFERMEKAADVTTQPTDILLRFANSTTLDEAPADRPDTTYTFPPPRIISSRWNTLGQLERRRSLVGPAVAEYVLRGHKLLVSGAERHLEGALQTGIGAIALAKTTAMSREAATDASYPYSELDPTTETYEAELQAIQLFTVTPLLSKVRDEVGTLLTRFNSPAIQRRYEGAWLKMSDREGWERQLAETRQKIGEIVTRSLDALIGQLKPYAAVADGQKPRPPKTRKAQTSAPHPYATAAEIYNHLHKEGEFAPAEKALIAHIAAGTWESIRSIHDAVRSRYETIVAFAAEHDLQPIVTRHDVAKVMKFSSTDTLENARTEVTRLRDRFRQKLTPDQYGRLQSALERS